CAAIFVNSRRHVAASPFLRRIDAEYIEAPPGVDPGMAEAPFSPKKPYLLFVGKLDVAGKGWDVLLRAWRILRERRPDLELTAAGAPPADAIRERGVTCTGFIHSREKLAELYASAAVTVLPSVIPESFGMALAEALIAGCPIVGSDIGGIPAVIEEGVNGYLAPAGDAEGLAAAMERALENGRELRRTILKNREAYMHRYNWDRTARIVAAILRRIGGEGRPVERRS
ncbi:MAG: glycosyltransferase family 4 protein, partial [Desulfobacterales bacterium]|nr:glycosyltransferase family 4 protein [Desulfobacterales bacterium]